MWDINAKREVWGSPRSAHVVHPHAKFDFCTPIWSTAKGRPRKRTINRLMSKVTRRGVRQISTYATEGIRPSASENLPLWI